MIPILRVGELREVEAGFAGRGVPLMARAGAAVSEEARRMAREGGEPILVVAGGGNNGGDAWVAAARLLETFHRVVVLDVAGSPPKMADARAARDALVAARTPIVREWPAALRPALVIDGLFGIGLARDADAAAADIIGRINGCGAPVLAVDVPSGLDAATGCIRGAAVRATATLTFIAHKPGLHTLDGPDCCGRVVVDDLGTGEETAAAARGTLVTPETVAPWLAPRPRNVHKGTFGTVGIVGGNKGMVGAALLAARGALLCGAGKVRVGLLAADALAVDPAFPEIMLGTVEQALEADVVIGGPGAGGSTFGAEVLRSSKSVVLDADALNSIAREPALAQAVAFREAPTIMTPHPAEAARLLGSRGDAVQADRVAAALEIARRFKAHVVLKGVGSVLASPEGHWGINATGNAGLASGGTGDVLSGMVGALLAQGLAPDRALAYAVCLHGAAADALVARGVGPVGITASEVALEARSVLNRWSASRS